MLFLKTQKTTLSLGFFLLKLENLVENVFIQIVQSYGVFLILQAKTCSYKNNSLHLVGNYAGIFVGRHCLFREAKQTMSAKLQIEAIFLLSFKYIFRNTSRFENQGISLGYFYSFSLGYSVMSRV